GRQVLLLLKLFNLFIDFLRFVFLIFLIYVIIIFYKFLFFFQSGYLNIFVIQAFPQFLCFVWFINFNITFGGQVFGTGIILQIIFINRNDFIIIIFQPYLFKYHTRF